MNNFIYKKLLAKSVEIDIQIPTLDMLRYASDIEFDNQSIYRIERQILLIFKWKIRFTTVYDLVEYFLYQGIVFSNEELEENKFQIKEIANKANGLARSKDKCFSVPNLLEKKVTMRLPRKRGIFGRSINVLKKMFFKTLSEKEPLKSLRIPFCVCSFDETPSLESFRFPSANEALSIAQKSVFSNIEITEFIANMEKNTLLLVRAIQMDHFFWKFDEKVLAAAIIAYARKHSGFEPYW